MDELKHTKAHAHTYSTGKSENTCAHLDTSAAAVRSLRGVGMVVASAVRKAHEVVVVVEHDVVVTHRVGAERAKGIR